MARRSDHTKDELRKLILVAARRITVEKGVDALSARKVAVEIGYTVGTIYQYFDSMDALVHAMNEKTLSALFETCHGHTNEGDPESKLIALGLEFVSYANAHTNEWTAVIGYRYKPDFEFSEAYQLQVAKLLGLIRESIAEFYESNDGAMLEDARMLWAGLYGVFSLDVSGRLGAGGSAEAIIRRLARTFVKSKD